MKIWSVFRSVVFFLALSSSAAHAAFSESFIEVSNSEFDQLKVQYYFQNSKNQKIVWTDLNADPNFSKKSLGTIIISPGRTESSLNWQEYSLALVKSGFNVAIIDHNGQGQSDRMIKSSDIGHIDRFETYVEDFNLFLNEVRIKHEGPFFLIANSMGAPVALLSRTDMFKKIVLHAPMFKIKTGPVPYFLAEYLSHFLMWLNRGDQYAPMTGPYRNETFEKNLFAKSRIRFSHDRDLLNRNPKSIVGGPSISWLSQAFRVPELIQSRIGHIPQAIILFQAEEENFVDREFQTLICRQAANCSLIVLPGSRHVFHLDTDENMNLLLNKTIDFLIQP